MSQPAPEDRRDLPRSLHPRAHSLSTKNRSVSDGSRKHGRRKERTGCTGVTERLRSKYQSNTCDAHVDEKRDFSEWLRTRTLVPNFDWSFDAPTTAYRGDDKKYFCIFATVRVMTKATERRNDHVTIIYDIYHRRSNNPTYTTPTPTPNSRI